MALLSPDSDPVHKATILPRGMALGLVMRLPERDKVSVSKAKLMADLCVAMGGRVAEELIFGKDRITTGASSDIKQATSIAKHMIIEWGMSEKLGFLSYAEDDGGVFLGHRMSQSKQISEKTSESIDSEVRALVDISYKKTFETLKSHMSDLKRIAEALLEYETLTGAELKLLLEGKNIERKPEEQLVEDVSIPFADDSKDKSEDGKEKKDNKDSGNELSTSEKNMDNNRKED